MTKALVTGATGFIGSAVVDLLARKGYEVTATDLPNADFLAAGESGARIAPMDITDRDGIGRLVSGMDVILHAAGIFDFAAGKNLLRAVNITAVDHICRASLEAGVKRFVQFSSTGVYGRPRRIPCREEDPKKPRNAYEKSKWEGEKVALSYYPKGLPVTVIRPTLVYGPRSRYGWAIHIATFAALRDRGIKKIFGIDGGPLAHSVHVEDVARAALLLTESPEALGRSFNVADDSPLSMGETFRAIIEPLGMRIGRTYKFHPYLYIPLARLGGLLSKVIPFNPFSRRNRQLQAHWEAMTAKYGLIPALRPRLDKDWVGYGSGDHCYDTSRIKALGFTPAFPDYRAGIRETIAWYQKNRWIPSFNGTEAA